MGTGLANRLMDSSCQEALECVHGKGAADIWNAQLGTPKISQMERRRLTLSTDQGRIDSFLLRSPTSRCHILTTTSRTSHQSQQSLQRHVVLRKEGMPKTGCSPAAANSIRSNRRSEFFSRPSKRKREHPFCANRYCI